MSDYTIEGDNWGLPLDDWSLPTPALSWPRPRATLLQSRTATRLSRYTAGSGGWPAALSLYSATRG